MTTLRCPCGSGWEFGHCCGILIEALGPATTAEALMRSRYSAYVLNKQDYLLNTWHPDTRPASLDHVQNAFIKWLELNVLATQAGGVGDERGTVEFIARYKLNGKAQQLHELSQFVRMNGQWFYVSAVQK